MSAIKKTKIFLRRIFYEVSFKYHNLILNIVIMSGKFSPDKLELFQTIFLKSFVRNFVFKTEQSPLFLSFFYSCLYTTENWFRKIQKFFYDKLSLEKNENTDKISGHWFSENVAKEAILLATLNTDLIWFFTHTQK